MIRGNISHGTSHETATPQSQLLLNTFNRHHLRRSKFFKVRTHIAHPFLSDATFSRKAAIMWATWLHDGRTPGATPTQKNWSGVPASARSTAGPCQACLTIFYISVYAALAGAPCSKAGLLAALGPAKTLRSKDAGRRLSPPPIMVTNNTFTESKSTYSPRQRRLPQHLDRQCPFLSWQLLQWLRRPRSSHSAAPSRSPTTTYATRSNGAPPHRHSQHHLPPLGLLYDP